MKHNLKPTQNLAHALGVVIACAITLLFLLLIFAGIKALWFMLF